MFKIVYNYEGCTTPNAISDKTLNAISNHLLKTLNWFDMANYH